MQPGRCVCPAASRERLAGARLGGAQSPRGRCAEKHNQVLLSFLLQTTKACGSRLAQLSREASRGLSLATPAPGQGRLCHVTQMGKLRPSSGEPEGLSQNAQTPRLFLGSLPGGVTREGKGRNWFWGGPALPPTYPRSARAKASGGCLVRGGRAEGRSSPEGWAAEVVSGKKGWATGGWGARGAPSTPNF